MPARINRSQLSQFFDDGLLILQCCKANRDVRVWRESDSGAMTEKTPASR
jgi:hypothetical protein